MEKDYTLLDFTEKDIASVSLVKWRDPFKKMINDELPAHLQKIAHSLISEQATDYFYYSEFSLPNLPEEDRKQIFKVLFPSIHEEVDLAWRTLDPNTITQRNVGKGSDGGIGMNPQILVTGNAHKKNLDLLILQLLLISGPLSDFTLNNLMATAEFLCHGKRIVYDSDSVAFVAVAVLNQGGKLAEPIIHFINCVLAKNDPIIYSRSFKTALFCSKQPKLWDKFFSLCPDGSNNNDLCLEFIDGYRGIHYQALVRYAENILEKNLLNQKSYFRRIVSELRIAGYHHAWDIPFEKDQYTAITTLFECLINEAKQSANLQSEDAIKVHQSLYALCCKDGEKGFAKAISFFNSGSSAQSLAGAKLLSDFQYFSDCSNDIVEGIKIRNIDAVLLFACLSRHSLRPHSEISANLCTILESFPKHKPTIDLPETFRPVKACLDDLYRWLVIALGGGEKDRITPWVDSLDEESISILLDQVRKGPNTHAKRKSLILIMLSKHLDIAQEACEELKEASLSDRESTFRELAIELEGLGKDKILLDFTLKQKSDEFCKSIRTSLGISVEAITRIESLREEMAELVISMNVFYIFKTKKLSLETHLKPEIEKEKVEQLIDKYKEVFAQTSVTIPSIIEHIGEFDYKGYQLLLENYLGSAISHLSEKSSVPIYAFSLLLNQDYPEVSAAWNTLEEFETTKSKYSGHNDFLLIKYSPVEFPKNTSIDGASGVNHMLRDYHESLHELFDVVGYDWIESFKAKHNHTLLEFTTKALEACSDRIAQLPTTSDFVFYVFPNDYSDETKKLTIRRTVSNSMFKEKFPRLN